MKLAHITDTHLGYTHGGRSDAATGRNQRTVDTERAFEAAVWGAIREGVDVVVHAGDVFHHARPPWKTVSHFIMVMRSLAAHKIPAVIIGGNHDTPRLRTTGSVFDVIEEALPAVTVAAGYISRSATVAGIDFACVPYGALPQSTRVEGDVLVAHGDPEPLALQLPERMYAALGHLHVRRMIASNAWYAGSTERFGWSDVAATPGWLLWEEGKITPIPVPHRPMVDLGLLIYGPSTVDELREKLNDFAHHDAIVRVTIMGASHDERRAITRIFQAAQDDLFWELRIMDVPVTEGGTLVHAGQSDLADIATLFSRFVAEKIKRGDYSPAFADRFTARATTALTNAQRDKEHEG